MHLAHAGSVSTKAVQLALAHTFPHDKHSLSQVAHTFPHGSVVGDKNVVANGSKVLDSLSSMCEGWVGHGNADVGYCGNPSLITIPSTMATTHEATVLQVGVKDLLRLFIIWRLGDNSSDTYKNGCLLSLVHSFIYIIH